MERHILEGENVAEFINEVKRLERVHIVTKKENVLLRTNMYAGNYELAGIELVPWEHVPESSKVFLRNKIRGKVANADRFL
jgi:hypothetical protein